MLRFCLGQRDLSTCLNISKRLSAPLEWGCFSETKPKKNILWDYFFLPWPTSCSGCTDGALFLLPKNQFTPSPHLLWGCQTHTPSPCQLTPFHLMMRFAKLPVVRGDGEEGGRGLGRMRRRGATLRNLQPARNRANTSSVWVCWEGGRSQQHPTCTQPATRIHREGVLCLPAPAVPPGGMAQLAAFESFCCNFCLGPAPVPPPRSSLSLCHPSRLSLGCGSAQFRWSCPVWRCRWVLCC